jgi:hypothetical protein
MEEIAIVRRRSRVVPILIALLVLAAIVVAVLYVIGTGGEMNIGAIIGADWPAPSAEGNSYGTS